ncbi:murein hydrolase activator EnvC family protein [Cytobacillus sp. FJAT-54145]|uniref:Murein hydrolase activator EnvC family protein n=1 Tax=Cytobacillus spartinae TaxID=3299023 RepID=A0ABW6KFI2_9BACI
MKKSVLTLSIVAALGFGSIVAGVPTDIASASKLQDLKNQKSELQNKRSDVNSQIDEAEQEIDSIQQEQAELKSEIKRLDLAIGDAETKIIEKQKEIEAKKIEIEELQKEIVVLTARINKRNELLKDRARSFQENGSVVSYLDVLMGAKSFGDFIDRLGAVATIVEADQDILNQHREDKKLLEEMQAQLENELASLENMLSELEEMKKSLNAQKAEKDKVMSALKKQEQQMHAEKLELEEEAQLLAKQQAAMQKAIQLEQKRIAEQQRQKQSGGSTPPVSNGTFTRPSAGYLSSGFGHRWGEFHAGVDIAAKGSVPIVSAADGVVIRSYYSSSYGNAIFISHSINGQIYTTVYAHMSSRSVEEGAVVAKGQQIGYMGNTGYSFGQHLHFELHKGPWNAGKTNAINPVGVVPL